jgi:hypothetical protein
VIDEAIKTTAMNVATHKLRILLIFAKIYSYTNQKRFFMFLINKWFLVPEHPQKDFLRNIVSIKTVAHTTERKAVDHTSICQNEFIQLLTGHNPNHLRCCSERS